MRSVDVEETGTGWATDYVFRIVYPGHRHEHSECPALLLRRRRVLGRQGSMASPGRGGRRGSRLDQDDTSGSGLSLSLGLLPAAVLPRVRFSSACSLSLPLSPRESWLSQSRHLYLYNILLVILSRPALGVKVVRPDTEGEELSMLPRPTA